MCLLLCCATHYSIVDPWKICEVVVDRKPRCTLLSPSAVWCLYILNVEGFLNGFKVLLFLNEAIQSRVFCPTGLHGDSGASPLAKNILDYRNEEVLGEFNFILVPDHLQRSTCSLWDTMRPGSASSRRKDKTPSRRPPVPSKSPQTPKKSQVSSETGLFSGLPSFKKRHYSNKFDSVSRLALLVIYKIQTICSE